MTHIHTQRNVFCFIECKIIFNSLLYPENLFMVHFVPTETNYCLFSQKNYSFGELYTKIIIGLLISPNLYI